MQKIPLNPLQYEVVMVDDCSADNSWSVIQQLCASHKYLRGLKLASNGGQWQSTLAGVSNARGKFIVTIDDDLQYEPADIEVMYRHVIHKGKKVVYGMPRNKYNLEGKNQLLSVWRKRIMHQLWNSPPTDSYRIFDRQVVFNNQTFLPRVFIDAYIVKNVKASDIDYIEASANKRYSGKSNVSFVSRIRLFILYSIHFHGIETFWLLMFFAFILQPVLLFLLFTFLFSTTVAYFIFIGVYMVNALLLYPLFSRKNIFPSYHISNDTHANK